MPGISVVIPAYRAARTIGQALESIVAQTLPPQEVIVVDDGSDDNTCEIAESFRLKLGTVGLKIIRQQSSGAGAARNRGVVEASCPVIAFLDSDDDWLPDHLRASLGIMLEKDYTLTAHNEWLVDEGVERLNDSASRLSEWRDPYVSLYCKGCISTSTVVVRKDAIKAAGGFDPTLINGQDVDLWLAILRQSSARFCIFDEPLSRYFISPGGINAQTPRRHKYFLLIARRWAREVANRPNGGFRALWFRMTAIHYETARSYLKSKNPVRALMTCLLLPIQLILIMIDGLSVGAEVERNFLQREGGESTMRSEELTR